MCAFLRLVSTHKTRVCSRLSTNKNNIYKGELLESESWNNVSWSIHSANCATESSHPATCSYFTIRYILFENIRYIIFDRGKLYNCTMRCFCLSNYFVCFWTVIIGYKNGHYVKLMECVAVKRLCVVIIRLNKEYYKQAYIQTRPTSLSYSELLFCKIMQLH